MESLYVEIEYRLSSAKVACVGEVHFPNPMKGQFMLVIN